MSKLNQASYAQSLFQAAIALVIGDGVKHEAAIIPVKETTKEGASIYQDRLGNGYSIIMRVCDPLQWRGPMVQAAAKAIHRITDGKRSGKLPEETLSRAARYIGSIITEDVETDFVNSLDVLIRAAKPVSKTPLESLVLETGELSLRIKVLKTDLETATEVFGLAGFTVLSLEAWKAANPTPKKTRVKASDLQSIVDTLRAENEQLRAANFRLSRPDSDVQENLPAAANG